MATLTIRGLSDDVRDRLRVRAARNGRSMEAEARAVIGASVGAPKTEEPSVRRRVERLQTAFAPYRAEQGSLVDELIAARRAEALADEGPSIPPSQLEKLDQARAILRQYVPEGTPLVDEFIAGRRAMWGET